MTGWFVIAASTILALLASLALGEFLCRRIAAYAQRRRARITEIARIEAQCGFDRMED